MSEGVRPGWARVGVTLLNLLGPGVGLLRTGRGRLALAFLAAPSAFLLLVILCSAAGPVPTPAAYTGLFGATILVIVVIYAGSMAATWRTSRTRPDESRWWSRWYGLLLAIVLSIAAANLLTVAAHAFYKPFHVPSEGMAPTLVKDDRFLAAMGKPSAPRRGDIVLFKVRERFTYVQRIAALPGDTIAMANGIVVLNGRPVPQRFVAEDELPTPSYGGTGKARRLLEQFPGEARPHAIYDLGPSDVDDVAEIRVGAGQLFVLGDNRDRSADSRVAPEAMGVGLLPIDDMEGRALFVTRGAGGRNGERLD
ncbi:MAG TPA: signal peptidase I [Allosphingosinicella sp.]|jgi:signal peptidase I